MNSLEDRRILVTGGTRGLGLGIVEALVKRKAEVAVVARDSKRLGELAQRLGITAISGDIVDRCLADSVLREFQPNVLILNAGAIPSMKPIHEQSWEEFSVPWEQDVKACLYWIQAAIRLPLPPGSRVLIGSSGAAIGGSPLSGGYAGAKKMLWFMADYANGVDASLSLGIRFQALVPTQIVGDTGVGDVAAVAYARRKGVSTAEFLAAFGKPMPPHQYGEHVATLLVDPAFKSSTALGIKGETGISMLDGTR
jgi:NAD(P)-dependent dehydrogenase (short-subunit alcohol dehydrogenase family)